MLGMMEMADQLPSQVNPTLVRMTARETIPNKDIVVRFGRKNSTRDISVLSWQNGQQGYFAMNIFPDLIDTGDAPKAIDMIFVLDISGSMSGAPIAKVKEIMNAMLDKARPVDRLSFMAFNTSVTNCFEQPVEATPANLAIARKWIDTLQASGGTEMLQGVQKGLAVPIDPDRVRIMSLLTDGYIGGIDAIYAAIKNDVNGTIPFTFGVGSSVNRELIDGAAAAGNGMAKVVLLNDPVLPLMDEFWSRIRAPQLSNITINWGGDVSNLTPSSIPSLWLGQPVTILGLYSTGGSRTITLTGEKNGETVSESYEAFFVTNNTFLDFVPKMWARQTMEELRNDQVGSYDEHNKDSILALSLSYEVLCQYTAFLAVADSVINESGEMIALEIGVPVPEGVDPYASGAITQFATQTYGMVIQVDSANPQYRVIAGDRLLTDNTPVVSIKSTKGLLNIVFKDIAVGSPIYIDIFDMRGRKIGSWRFNSKSDVFVWNWNYQQKNITSGMYTLVIRAHKKLARTVVLR